MTEQVVYLEGSRRPPHVSDPHRPLRGREHRSAGEAPPIATPCSRTTCSWRPVSNWAVNFRMSRSVNSRSTPTSPRSARSKTTTSSRSMPGRAGAIAVAVTGDPNLADLRGRRSTRKRPGVRSPVFKEVRPEGLTYSRKSTGPEGRVPSGRRPATANAGYGRRVWREANIQTPCEARPAMQRRARRPRPRPAAPRSCSRRSISTPASAAAA